MPTRRVIMIKRSHSLTAAAFSSSPPSPSPYLTPSKASLSFLFDSEQVPAGTLCSFTILWERRERERKREGDCQKHYMISKRPVHSQQSFDSGQGGVRVRKTQGEGLSELFKEGSVIYRDPHIEGRVGWMKLWGGEWFSAGCPAVKKRKKKFKQASLSVSVCLPLSLSPLAFPLIFNKQQLRLSATGRQFVPTTKNHGNNHWKSLSGSKGPPSLASPAPSALWAFCKFGWGGRFESISKWAQTRW